MGDGRLGVERRVGSEDRGAIFIGGGVGGFCWIREGRGVSEGS